jgi:hypothetical protein
MKTASTKDATRIAGIVGAGGLIESGFTSSLLPRT